MSNEQMARERIKAVSRVERAVEQGQDGLVEVREMYQQGVMGEGIVRMLRENVREVVLAAFIDNFCE